MTNAAPESDAFHRPRPKLCKRSKYQSTATAATECRSRVVHLTHPSGSSPLSHTSLASPDITIVLPPSSPRVLHTYIRAIAAGPAALSEPFDDNEDDLQSARETLFPSSFSITQNVWL